jgi:hypothetical protein
MNLDYLLDENISPVVADQVKRHRPEISIDSVHRWREGEFVNCKDEEILLAAASEGLTLVTYDQRTIPTIIDRLIENGLSHAGIIYVDERTIANGNIGQLVKALIELWSSEGSLNWHDRIYQLAKPKP